MPTRGISLVEVLVALMLLAVGVSAAARASASLGRLAARSASLSRVARLSQWYLEALPLQGCVTSAGRYTEDVLEVVWQVSTDGVTGSVRLDVLWPQRGGMVVDTFTTAFLCPL